MSDDKKTNITPELKDLFTALTSGEYSNFALVSCFVDGEPASAIVVARRNEDELVEIKSVFVSITPGMVLTDHDGNEPISDEEEQWVAGE